MAAVVSALWVCFYCLKQSLLSSPTLYYIPGKPEGYSGKDTAPLIIAILIRESSITLNSNAQNRTSESAFIYYSPVVISTLPKR